MVADMIEAPGMRVMVSVRIALAQAGTSHVGDAPAPPPTLDVAGLRGRALQLIVRGQLATEDIQGALASARAIADAPMRREMLHQVARLQQQVDARVQAQEYLRAGSFQDALAAAKLLEDGSARDPLPHDIAAGLLQTGNHEDALAVVEMIGSAPLRTQVLAQAVRSQTEAGDLQGALATARSIEDAQARDQALHVVVQAQAERRVEEALAITEAIEADDVHDQALAAVIGEAVAGGKFRGHHDDRETNTNPFCSRTGPRRHYSGAGPCTAGAGRAGSG